MSEQTPFTFKGFASGLRAGVPLAAAVLPYGVAFGALATEKGLAAETALAMSAIVHSGAAQFAALQVWSAPPVLLTLLFATFAMNARYLLYGALLRPHLSGLSPVRSYGALFMMGDANWALMMRHGQAGALDGAFAVGTGLAMYLAWQCGTLIGAGPDYGQGALEGFGLEFLLPIYFATMIAGLWRDAADLWPLVVGASAAVIGGGLLGAGWSIPCGVSAGLLLGSLRVRHDR